MNVEQAYNQWAGTYDTNENKTRDLEARALRLCLAHISFERCLELGCGTGKNTEWLLHKAKEITAVDLSDEMLAKAKNKFQYDYIQFVLADITRGWHFATGLYDLITFSLVLEHIEHLAPALQNASDFLKAGGYLYIGELHPFKQYNGSKARFETERGTQVIPCFTHHISDFTSTAKASGLQMIDLREYFDEDDKNVIPRILAITFQKN